MLSSLGDEMPKNEIMLTNLMPYLEVAGLAFVSMSEKIKDALDISDEEFIRLRTELEKFLDNRS
jgi:hypothetical protein